MERSESVAAVALRHGLNTNLVFKWRQRYAVTRNGAAALLPIRIAPVTTTLDQPRAGGTGTETDPQGHVEIRLSSGHQLRLQGEVDAALVRVVLEMLR